MALGYKNHGLIITAFLFFLLFNEPLNAAWWQIGGIPEPPNSKLEKKDTREVSAGTNFDFSFYKSDLSIEQIEDFYRKTLIPSGWKEKDLLKDMRGLPELKTGPALHNVMGLTLIFEKEDDMLLINFMPEGAFKDGKARFSLSRGKISQLSKPTVDSEQEDTFLPRLSTRPKKELFPEYPGSSLISLNELTHAQKAIYLTRDSLYSVVEFYEGKIMLDYGWDLTGEKQPEKITLGGLNKYEKSKNILFSELIFTKEGKKILRIGVAQTLLPQETDYSYNVTTITVAYDEKKK